MSDTALRELATQDDMKAQVLLANRLRPHRYTQPTDAAQLDEAERWLRRAALLGATAGLTELGDLYQFESQRPANRNNRSPLIKAYAFHLVAQQRGDFNAETGLTVLNEAFPLDTSEQQQAEQLADATYRQLQQERASLGLPALSDGVPDDVLAIHQKIEDLIVAPMRRAFNASIPKPKQP